MNLENDLSFVSPEQLEAELQRRKMEEPPQPQDEPPQPVEAPLYRIPPIRQRLEPPPQPLKPSLNINTVRVILSQSWLNTIMNFVILGVLGIILITNLLEIVLYQGVGIFLYIFILAIFWIFTNKNLSPKNL